MLQGINYRKLGLAISFMVLAVGALLLVPHSNVANTSQNKQEKSIATTKNTICPLPEQTDSASLVSQHVILNQLDLCGTRNLADAPKCLNAALSTDGNNNQIVTINTPDNNDPRLYVAVGSMDAGGSMSYAHSSIAKGIGPVPYVDINPGDHVAPEPEAIHADNIQDAWKKVADFAYTATCPMQLDTTEY